MTSEVQIALLAALPPTLTVLASMVVSYHSRHKLAQRIESVHLDVNSRLTQLLEAARLAERAKGVEEGRELGKNERQDRVAEEERVRSAIVAEQERVSDRVIDVSAPKKRVKPTRVTISMEESAPRAKK